MSKRLTFLAIALVLAAVSGQSALAQKKYGPGVSDTEIKLGQTVPYSGPLSATSLQSKTEAAYYKMINESGGINGRMINMISLDDAYNPAKTVEQTRRLVESDNVLALSGSVGTPNILAVQKYINSHKVPLILVASGDARFFDPKDNPWSTGFTPIIENEAKVYAQYILAEKPNARIGILYQNDDLGKAYVRGLRAALGDKAATMIVKEVSYEVSEPTVDSEIVTLQASGADVLMDAATQRFTAQAIRKAYDIGWHPLHIIIEFVTSVSAVLKPAGLDRSTGVVSVLIFKQPLDPRNQNDKGVRDYLAFVKNRMPDADPDDFFVQVGYSRAELSSLILRNCGDDLTRENVLRQATNLKNVQLSLMLPGVVLNTAPDNYAIFRSLQMARFDGKFWTPIGNIVTP